MALSISETVNTLTEIVDKDPIDWTAFDAVLSSIEDINYLDESAEETILTEFLHDWGYYRDGAPMPEVVRHFLAKGYDVMMNDGRNGGLALSELRWSSNDKFILETAKILLDAGAPIEYMDPYAEPGEEELAHVLADIEWGLADAWTLDTDFVFGNILGAYYAIIEAVQEGKDYHSIDCYLECIGKELTGVSVIVPDNAVSISNMDALSTFSEALILWFGNTPLVISNLVEFVINPIAVDEYADRCQKADNLLAPILGHALRNVQYFSADSCFLEFDNGIRLIFSGIEKGQDRVVAFELSSYEKIDFDGLRIDSIICQERGLSEECSLILMSDEKAYLAYFVEDNSSGNHIEGFECDRMLLRNYVRQLVIPKPTANHVYYKDGHVYAMRFDCGNEYLYIRAFDSYLHGFEIWHSDEALNMEECDGCPDACEKQLEFKAVNLLDC